MGAMQGELFFDIVTAFTLAAMIAVPLLFTIRGSMRRFMRRRQGAVFTPPVAPRRPNAPTLRVEFAETGEVPATADGRLLAARARRLRRAFAGVHMICGLACAAVLAYADLAEMGVNARRYAVMLAIHIWPMVLAVVSVAAISHRAKRLVLPAAAAVSLLFTMAVSHSPAPWLIYAGPPTLLILLTANRRLETIAPVVAIFALTAAFAANRAMDVLRRMPDNTSCLVVVIMGVVVLAVAFAFVALLVAAYRRKLFSDLSFKLGFLWLTFCAWYVILRGSTNIWWAGVAAFGLYALLAAMLLSLVRAAVRRRHAASVLVLRAFGAPERAQRLFEELGARWRMTGPLHLVAGTDSAVANLDLDEALRYLTFRFRSLFITGAADLERRLQHLDTTPDLDGRYRTNDFFCFDDTWKPAFTRLLERSYAVLVDLGGFDKDHAGVAFELGQLLARRPLASLVIVTSSTTKFEDLRATLSELWSRMDPGAPNAGLTAPLLRLLHEPSPRVLVAALCDAAVAGGWTARPRV